MCYYRRFYWLSQPMTAFVIDAFEFARQQEHREGRIAIADLPRLAKKVRILLVRCIGRSPEASASWGIRN